MRDHCSTKHFLMKQHLKTMSNQIYRRDIMVFLILGYLKIKPLNITCFSVRRTQDVRINENGTRMVKIGLTSKFSVQFIVHVAPSLD